ncbi:MAG: hypothetical protein RIQ81_744 [Pseudomonadota bacterium]|jgi:hypothetical protein
MRNWLVLAAVFVTAIPVRAFATVEFDQHLAGNPNTAGHLRFNFEACPGTLSVLTERNLFLNTLSVGIGNHIEVGTVPILNMVGKSRNWTIKGNAFRNEYVSIGAAWMRYTIAYNSGDKNIVQNTDGFTLLGAAALSSTTHLGLSISTDYYSSNDRTVEKYQRTIEPSYEKFVDLSRRFARNWNWSWGLSHTTNYFSPVILYGKKAYEWGLGGSLNWHPERMLVSKIGLGTHRFLATNRNLYLMSLSF